MELFFFGTLRDPELLRIVLGGPPDGLTIVPAHMPDAAAERAEGYDFPILTPSPGRLAEGLLVSGLSVGQLDRVRFFEDFEYELRPVEVVAGGGRRTAHAFGATAALPSSGEPWDFAAWASARRSLMLAVTRELMEVHYGRIEPRDVDAVWRAIYDRLSPAAGTER